MLKPESEIMIKRNEAYNWMIQTTKRVKKILALHNDPISYNKEIPINSNKYDFMLLLKLMQFELDKKILELEDENDESDPCGELTVTIFLTYDMFKDLVDEFFKNCRFDDPSKDIVSYRVDLLRRLMDVLTLWADFSCLKPI